MNQCVIVSFVARLRLAGRISIPCSSMSADTACFDPLNSTDFQPTGSSFFTDQVELKVGEPYKNEYF